MKDIKYVPTVHVTNSELTTSPTAHVVLAAEPIS